MRPRRKSVPQRLFRCIIAKKLKSFNMESEDFATRLISVGRELRRVQNEQVSLRIPTPSEIPELLAVVERFIQHYGMSLGYLTPLDKDYEEICARANEKIGKFLSDTCNVQCPDQQEIRDAVLKFDKDGLLSKKDDSTSSNDFSDSSV